MILKTFLSFFLIVLTPLISMELTPSSLSQEERETLSTFINTFQERKETKLPDEQSPFLLFSQEGIITPPQEENQESFLLKLPPEVVVMILQKLPPQELREPLGVCRFFEEYRINLLNHSHKALKIPTQEDFTSYLETLTTLPKIMTLYLPFISNSSLLSPSLDLLKEKGIRVIVPFPEGENRVYEAINFLKQENISLLFPDSKYIVNYEISCEQGDSPLRTESLWTLKDIKEVWDHFENEPPEERNLARTKISQSMEKYSYEVSPEECLRDSPFSYPFLSKFIIISIVLDKAKTPATNSFTSFLPFTRKTPIRSLTLIGGHLYSNADPSIKGLELDMQVISELAQTLQENKTLQHLHLRGNQLGAEALNFLALASGIFKNLQSLELPSNQIGKKASKALVSVLKNLPNLQSLNLFDNRIGPEGAQALALALKNLPYFQSLNLSKNRIGPEGVQALVTVLKNLPYFQRLNLSKNTIGDQGAQALAAALKNLSHLQSLVLSKNQIGPGGAQALAAALENLPNLQRLDLLHNQIDKKGLETLVDSLIKYCPHLKQLGINLNNIKRVEYEDLRRLLRENHPNGLSLLWT